MANTATSTGGVLAWGNDVGQTWSMSAAGANHLNRSSKATCLDPVHLLSYFLTVTRHTLGFCSAESPITLITGGRGVIDSGATIS
jgi:hypothetical protein